MNYPTPNAYSVEATRPKGWVLRSVHSDGSISLYWSDHVLKILPDGQVRRMNYE